jgi:hypothetical protein
MSHEINTEAVRQALNRSAAGLDQPTLAKLRNSREQALAHFDARNKAPVLAWISELAGIGHSTGSHRHYHWAFSLLLAVALFGGAMYWQHATEHDNSDVDIAILTDDMPIDVYVD